MIAYNGRGLNQAEKNYSTTEREALALMEGIKKFQHYLHHRRFTVVTDHSSLHWLMNVKDASGHLARWALLLQQYDFAIFKTKLVSSTLRTVAVKLVYFSPTRFI